MQISKAKTSEDLCGLGIIQNEDPRGLRRLYKGRNYVSKFQENLHRSKLLIYMANVLPS